nr:lipocalin-15 [Loxodonta africana]
MKSAVVLLGPVVALLWLSEAGAEVLVQPDFDARKFSGLWYVVAMVSDCKVFLGKKDHLLMSTRAIEATEEGDLHVRMAFPRADGCNQVDAEYLRVGSAGHFRVPALGYLDVRISDTDYSSFAVVYIYKELEGAFSTMVQLYSRTQDVSPEAMKAFQDFYPTVGLPEDMAVTLPKSGTCSARLSPLQVAHGLPPPRESLGLRCLLLRGQGGTLTLQAALGPYPGRVWAAAFITLEKKESPRIKQILQPEAPRFFGGVHTGPIVAP